MTFARLCEHGEVKAHVYFLDVPIPHDCPGGVVLDPEQTIVIEKEDGEWPEWVYQWAHKTLSMTQLLDALAAAQEGKETELSKWRPIGETKWRDGEPPSSAEMYEVRLDRGGNE